MPQAGFEPTIPVFVWAKTVYTLDRAATVIGHVVLYGCENCYLFSWKNRDLGCLKLSVDEKI
jgi:hypothetical protein